MKALTYVILTIVAFVAGYGLGERSHEQEPTTSEPVTNNVTLTPTSIETLYVRTPVLVALANSQDAPTIKRDTVYTVSTNYFKTNFDSLDKVMEYQISGYATSAIDSLKFKYEIKTTFLDSIEHIGYAKAKPTPTQITLVLLIGLAMGLLCNL